MDDISGTIKVSPRTLQRLEDALALHGPDHGYNNVDSMTWDEALSFLMDHIRYLPGHPEPHHLVEK